MHRIKALSGATELGEDEEQTEQAVVDYGSEDADGDLNIKKVLVVDDEPNIRDLLATSLRFAGFSVHAVANGADAVYFGVERFNARLRAENFQLADLPEVMAWLHRRGEVISRKDQKNGKIRLEVRMDEDRAGQAKAMFGRAMSKLA